MSPAEVIQLRLNVKDLLRRRVLEATPSATRRHLLAVADALGTGSK